MKILLVETEFVCEEFGLLADAGFAYKMDGTEFQDMCTEDLSRWMRDNGVPDCSCEVFEGEYVICIYVYIYMYIISMHLHGVIKYSCMHLKILLEKLKSLKVYCPTPFEQATVS